MHTFVEYVNGRSIDKKKLDKIGDYTIFLVNASKIRDTSQEDNEFNDFATNLEFPKLVPNREIWISQDISKHERQFLIHNGIHQYEGKKKGKRSWYDYALRLEKIEREKVDHIKFKGKETKTPPDKVYYKYYCGIPSPNDDIEVWLVNGEIVRNLFKTDLVLGGNDQVYRKFIPQGEIWIEKNIKEPGEIDITILHEYIESTLMLYKKMSYDKAHNIAAKVEHQHRGKWKIEDVKALNREEALKMAKKYM